MYSVLFASGNPNKLRDMQAFLAEGPIRLLSPQEVMQTRSLAAPPIPAETGTTYFENARIKADAFGAWSGLPTLSDDAGIEVFALDGAPGVHSAYFAGPDATHEENNRKMLHQLRGVGDRRALFRSTLCLRMGEGQYLVSEGTLEGILLDAPRGRTGWGYEPLFELPSSGLTIAEMRDAGMHIESHRTRSTAALCRLFSELR
jgi:XTP/dITP diphosphohydrolase